MELTRRPLVRLDEAGFFDPKTPPGSAPKGKTPWKPGMLAPGDAAITPHAELGRRSHDAKVARTSQRLVTFRTRIGAEVHYSVEASTDKQAVQRARYVHHVRADWKAIKVDSRPFEDK